MLQLPLWVTHGVKIVPTQSECHQGSAMGAKKVQGTKKSPS